MTVHAMCMLYTLQEPMVDESIHRPQSGPSPFASSGNRPVPGCRCRMGRKWQGGRTTTACAPPPWQNKTYPYSSTTLTLFIFVAYSILSQYSQFVFLAHPQCQCKTAQTSSKHASSLSEAGPLYPPAGSLKSDKSSYNHRERVRVANQSLPRWRPE